VNILYLSTEELIEIHRLLIEEFGGNDDLRDRGLLESACYRPQSGYYPTLFSQAAALLHSLATSHAFIDGNKRIAWVAAKTFLYVNGQHVRAASEVAEPFIVDDVIVGRMELFAIAAWLEKHARPR
jgi:death-on-curing protein